VRRTEELVVADLITSPSGKLILDLGQNISGRMRFTVSGPAGTEIVLRHAEVLEHGELGTRPLRGAAQTDRYTLAGSGSETYEPTFTIHGFRYVEVTGWPGEPDPAAFTGVVCHSDMERTGWFECSHDGLNRLHENVVWSMRDNFVDVPTDCPQRDERLGWTGDIQVFAPTATFLYDCRTFLTSWLRDLAYEQSVLGTVPVYVPWIQLLFPPLATAAWGDAAVIVPWVMYERFGDESILRAQYESMKAWVDGVAAEAGDDHLWTSGLQLGDWLDPSAPPDRPGDARTDKFMVSTAYHAHSTRLLARAAEVVGDADDATRYHRLADEIVAAFDDEFVTPSGRLASDAQTAYAMALRFDLLRTDGQRARAAARLAELVAAGEYHIGTGFVGTPLVCDALADAGFVDDAYHLLLQDTCPSWLYPVTMGATTIWERWDSMLPDGSINPGDMTSFNHYALGAVADFLHRVVAGLTPAEPGYRRLLVRPRPGGGLTWASARLRTAHGEAAVSWRRDGEHLTVEVTVPEGATADVDVPGCDTTGLDAGVHVLTGTYRSPADDPPRPKPWSPFEALADPAD
jgi:alpha-L-rhamnosidase